MMNQTLRNWFKARPFSERRKWSAPFRMTRKLAFERLEDRTLLAVSLTFSGTQTLMGAENLNVSNDPPVPGDPVWQSEMTLHVNPKNPLNLAGFSHRIDPSAGFWYNEIDVFYSMNGGATWSVTRIDDGTNGKEDGLGPGNRYDPLIAFDANGNLFIAYVHADAEGAKLVVARDTNGGAGFYYP